MPYVIAAACIDVMDRSGQEHFVADNLRFFEDPLPGRPGPLGQPGGAADLGPVGIGTDLVASYQRDS